jgi:hypothetical protein
MANIQLQRGQNQNVDVTYKLSGATVSLNLSSGYDAELVIRRKRGDRLQGQVLDTLRFGPTANTAVPEADSRIYLAGASSGFNYATDGPNIQLRWNTAQSTLLPNEAVTVYGDLKIFATAGDYNGETLYHIRLTFDILPEITA